MTNTDPEAEVAQQRNEGKLGEAMMLGLLVLAAIDEGLDRTCRFFSGRKHARTIITLDDPPPCQHHSKPEGCEHPGGRLHEDGRFHCINCGETLR
jgi:hypothetical protein